MRLTLLTTVLFSSLLALPIFAQAEVDFAHEIAPILKAHCVECHGEDKAKGGFSLNTRELFLEDDMAVPGDSSKSEFLLFIEDTDPEYQMPPEKKSRVPAEKVALLKKWVDAGMPWTAGFTFAKDAYEPPLKPRTPTLPAVTGNRTHVVDRIVDAYFAEQKITRPKIADDSAFLRRVSMDLTGLLPTPEEVRAFLADTSSDKRLKKIDELLARETAYADHWLTFWNDLLRNDYAGTGFITNGRTQISGWLYDSLLANKPFNQFASELIAAKTPETAGFINGIKWRGEVSAGQTVEIQFAQSISQSFLGINMKCASCHDSFIDRWKLTDAYGLAAIYAEKPLEIHRCDIPVGETAKASWLFPELGEIDPAAPRQERLNQLAALMTHPENGRFTRTIVNRLWAQMMGRGIVHPLDAMQSEPWNADLLDYIASDFQKHDYDIKRTLRLIAASQIYQSQTEQLDSEADAGGEFIFKGPRARRLTSEQFVDAVWQISGTAPAKADAPVKRDNKNMIRASLLKSDFLMNILGRPNRDQIVSSRPGELTTLEAVDLSNSQLLADHFKTGATKFDGDQAIENLYLATLTRMPTDNEKNLIQSVLGENPSVDAKADLLWSIFMSPEFFFVR